MGASLNDRVTGPWVSGTEECMELASKAISRILRGCSAAGALTWWMDVGLMAADDVDYAADGGDVWQ